MDLESLNKLVTANSSLAPANSSISTANNPHAGNIFRSAGRATGNAINTVKGLATRMPVPTGALGVLGGLSIIPPYASAMADNQKQNPELYRNLASVEDAGYDQTVINNELDKLNALRNASKATPSTVANTNNVQQASTEGTPAVNPQEQQIPQSQEVTPTPTPTATTQNQPTAQVATTVKPTKKVVSGSKGKGKASSVAGVTPYTVTPFIYDPLKAHNLVPQGSGSGGSNTNGNGSNNGFNWNNVSNYLSNLDNLLPLLMAGYFGYTLGK